jgi:hypothetical protein
MEETFPMKILLTTAAFVAFALSPVSAKMMACTGPNIGATLTTVGAMPDSPKKMATNKHMSMANTEMSKGNMRGACTHYMMAQKAIASK